jgi:hypothetical protein
VSAKNWFKGPIRTIDLPDPDADPPLAAAGLT